MLSRRILLGSVAAPAVVLVAVSLAWACVPQGSLILNPTKGPAGSQVMASGNGFPADTVEIRWGSRTGPLLATTQGPAFNNVPITIPGTATAGVHYVNASGLGEHGEHSATDASFEIPAGSTPPGSQGPPGGQQPGPGGQQPAPGGQQPTPVTPPAGKSRRAKAIARCKRKYSAKRANTRSKRRRLAKRRKACLRKAKKLSAAQASTFESVLPPLFV